jgi:hypothetical protein
MRGLMTALYSLQVLTIQKVVNRGFLLLAFFKDLNVASEHLYLSQLRTLNIILSLYLLELLSFPLVLASSLLHQVNGD